MKYALYAMLISLLCLGCDNKVGKFLQSGKSYTPLSIEKAQEHGLLFAKYKYDTLLSSYNLDSSATFEEIWMYYNAAHYSEKPYIRKGKAERRILGFNIKNKNIAKGTLPWKLDASFWLYTNDSANIFLRVSKYKIMDTNYDTIKVDVYHKDGVWLENEMKLGYFILVRDKEKN